MNYRVLSKIPFIISVLIACFLPFCMLFGTNKIGFFSHIQWISVFIITYTAGWIFTGNLINKIRIIKKNKLVWTFSSLYLINVPGLLYSVDLKKGLTVMTVQLSLLLFPILSATSRKFNIVQINTIFAFFTFSSLLASLMTFRHGMSFLNNTESDLTTLTSLLVLHRAYFGMYLVFIIFIIFTWITKSKSLVIKIILILLIAYCIWFILIIYAKMAIIALSLSFFLIFTIRYRAKRLFLISIYIFFATCIILILLLNESAQIVVQKITMFDSFSFDEYSRTIVNSINLRFIHWSCASDILFKNGYWFYGTGTGDVSSQLDYCYIEKGYAELRGYDAHNEFMQEWLKLGISGLIIFVINLLIPFWLSIKHQQYLYTGFITVFALCCLTETMLSVQAGTIFYAFFNSIFAFQILEPTISNYDKLSN